MEYYAASARVVKSISGRSGSKSSGRSRSTSVAYRPNRLMCAVR
ncbi:hypothetical protein ACFLIM_41970 [Nonomuraea sp. M3C6]|uniref:Uncharacterized protein n=1 Tax=Nonomuraea marmarensis TaxID=3351344 RepID=A0ABW7ATN5_9ACTN